ncbi:MAG: heparinase II/III-family protein, partial [Candidatus Kapabacteria bacterium]|nr:heparinase II/III-family protein [Candidatus Kapabacteria bacterium]
EASIPYHRLSAEMIVWALAILKKAKPDYTIHTDVYNRLQAIYSFTASYIYSTGKAPQIGDNDSGRFLPIFPSVYTTSTNTSVFDYQQHQHVLAGLEALLEIPVSHSHPEYTIVKELVGTYIGTLSSATNKYSLTFLQCIQIGDIELRIRAGEIGQKDKGGHAHNDQLSFTMAIQGIEFLVDPGTFVYAPLPDERNAFRSTAMHNTLQVGTQEQNTWNTGTLDSLFWLQGDKTATRVIKHTDTEWQGEHSGFTYPHKRTFTFTETEIQLTDECSAPEDKTIRFHLHPACMCSVKDPNTIKIERNGIELEITTVNNQLHIQQSRYSRGYGLSEPSTVLVCSGKENVFQTHIRLIKSH